MKYTNLSQTKPPASLLPRGGRRDFGAGNSNSILSRLQEELPRSRKHGHANNHWLAPALGLTVLLIVSALLWFKSSEVNRLWLTYLMGSSADRSARSNQHIKRKQWPPEAWDKLSGTPPKPLANNIDDKPSTSPAIETAAIITSAQPNPLNILRTIPPKGAEKTSPSLSARAVKADPHPRQSIDLAAPKRLAATKPDKQNSQRVQHRSKVEDPDVTLLEALVGILDGTPAAGQ